jgi:hypothetical protein
MRGRNSLAALLLGASLTGAAAAATDLDFASAETVNEGSLTFLAAPPARAVHHHRNRIRIDADSLATGWVHLYQCHDHLDAVPRAQITFREGYIRDLKVESFASIGEVWVEGASVQLSGVRKDAQLCLSAQTRALRDRGQGYFALQNGPYMRKFLDGYYPMRVTLDVEYPASLLRVLDVSPPAQPGLALGDTPGQLHIDALFEGELVTLVQFERD